MTLPRTILVATDFSEHADHALEYAVELAAHLDATIHLVHAITMPPTGIPELNLVNSVTMIEALTKEGQAALDARVDRCRDRVTFGPARLELGDAREVIDRVAEQVSADLIVMGTHGRRGIRRALLGSVAESVVRSAPCPVLTIRPKRT